MQTELLNENAASIIRNLGINQIGAEAGNLDNCNGRDIPWLQDTTADDVWTDWAVTYRDVVVLNAANEPVAVYNLTVHDLSDSANYAELKQILKDAAGE
jgi:hypothetical protein